MENKREDIGKRIKQEAIDIHQKDAIKQGDTPNPFTIKRKQARYFDHEKIMIETKSIYILERLRKILMMPTSLSMIKSNGLENQKRYAITTLRQDWEETPLDGEFKFLGSKHTDISSSFSRRSLYCYMLKQASISPKYQRITGIYPHFLIKRSKSGAIKLPGLYDKICRTYNPSLKNDPSTSTISNKKTLAMALWSNTTDNDLIVALTILETSVLRTRVMRILKL
ncbi:hypothetical protein K501DRAFT_330710 [Backusella circina FSU 941]|nr:hypothetical protein K501DRAFT_330710 [Backusella circina FSU 941]